MGKTQADTQVGGGGDGGRGVTWTEAEWDTGKDEKMGGPEEGRGEGGGVVAFGERDTGTEGLSHLPHNTGRKLRPGLYQTSEV